MKKNLLTKEASNNIIERVKKLTIDNTPLWGEMNVTEMLLHCNLCNKQILEESRGDEKTTAKQFLLRIFALYIAPNFKKGIKSEKRNITKGLIDNTQFEKQQIEFISIINKFPYNNHALTLSHPAFGNISTTEWGIAAFKHMDHHLRQFGV
ncbi:MAG: DUF1569 domain-containing protein [Chitinophagaceae bacterium]|nr:DUF1569 domain-containing protein [Chitinophagaceae bacterium]MCW5903986.1 DUF1569 domain-containing protein [Chitinophagaceae bacterium]